MDLWWEEDRFENVLKALGVVDAHASLGMWEYLNAHAKVDDGKWTTSYELVHDRIGGLVNVEVTWPA